MPSSTEWKETSPPKLTIPKLTFNEALKLAPYAD